MSFGSLLIYIIVTYSLYRYIKKTDLRYTFFFKYQLRRVNLQKMGPLCVHDNNWLEDRVFLMRNDKGIKTASSNSNTSQM